MSYFDYIKQYNVLDYTRNLDLNNLDMFIKYCKNICADIEKRRICYLSEIVKEKSEFT